MPYNNYVIVVNLVKHKIRVYYFSITGQTDKMKFIYFYTVIIPIR